MSPYDQWLMRVGPSVVYRFYDDEDQLLYVGCTNSTHRRFAEHFATPARGWQAEVARIETFQYPDRRSAEESEARAIFTEGPLFNGPGGVNGSHKRMFGSARAPDPVPRIRERIAHRLGSDPGKWASRRRQEAERVPFVDLVAQIWERTSRFCAERWLVAWASEFGEDPWCAAVQLAWSSPDWKSKPANEYAYARQSWRLP